MAEPPPVVYGKGGGADQGWHELKDEIETIMRAQLDEALADLPDDVQAEGVMVTGDPADGAAGGNGEGRRQCWSSALAPTDRSEACCSARSPAA